MSHPELRDFSPKMTLNFFWKGLIDSLEFTQITILVKDFWTESLQKLKLRRNKALRRKCCSSTCLATYKGLDNTLKECFQKAELKHTIKTILHEAVDKKNFPCFQFTKQLVPLLRGKKRASTWTTHTRANVDEANIIAQKFSEILEAHH